MFVSNVITNKIKKDLYNQYNLDYFLIRFIFSISFYLIFRVFITISIFYFYLYSTIYKYLKIR